MTWSRLAVSPTPAGKAQAAAVAATVAAAKIQQASSQPKPRTPVAPKPAKQAPVSSRPATVSQAVANTATAAQGALKETVNTVLSAAQVPLASAQQAHVIIKKQPLWIQVVTVAASALGAYAGFRYITADKRRAA